MAVGMIARGFHLPSRSARLGADSADAGRPEPRSRSSREVATQSRAARTAAAAVAMERRDTMIFAPPDAANDGGGDTSSSERRVTVGGGGARADSRRCRRSGLRPRRTRLGQETRRASGPRTMRSGSAGGSGGLR